MFISVVRKPLNFVLQLYSMLKAVFGEKVAVRVCCLSIQNFISEYSAAQLLVFVGRQVLPHPMISAPAVCILFPSPKGFGGIGDTWKVTGAEERDMVRLS